MDLITVTIDDFTILDDVNFDTAGGATTLTVESLTIDGHGSNGGPHEVVVTLTGTTTIKS